jgi:SAM-dependent MidA family methyltransferase
VPDAADPAPLGARLRERIRADGPLRFDDWVDACLYDPQGGFYARGAAVGPGGAFATAPTLHPAFAAAVAAETGGAGIIVEAGPGDGSLAAAIGATVLIEPAAGMRQQQARAVPAARFVAAAAELDPFAGALVANEVLDAVPFRLVEDGREVWVGLDADGRFTREPRPTDLEGPDAGPFTVRPRLGGFVAELIRPVQMGSVLFVDYGADGPGGDVRTYIGGQPGGDPLQAPGTQDITADVDFSVVRGALGEAGFQITYDGSQAAWLRGHGASVPEPRERTDDDWRLARLLDESKNWRVLAARR